MRDILKHRLLFQAACGAAAVGVVAVLVVGASGAGAAPGTGNGRAAHAQSAHGGGVSSGDTTAPQPPSNADYSGHGANVHGPYDSTRDGSPAQNGNGNGKAVGKPCAGCVGKADNKNPPGQRPGGSDANAGYECDRNHGVGRSNPAHTGCTAASTPLTTTPLSSTPPGGGKSSRPPGGAQTSTPPESGHWAVSARTASAAPQPASPNEYANVRLPSGLARTGTSDLTALVEAAAALLLLGCVTLIAGRRTRHR